MAQGFNPKRNQKKPAAAKGGKITGPGTGTSDDIQKEIPSGSYIMPADSTEAVGQEALEGMGRGVPIGEPVDALVSNGEYEFTPEQVHAIGVQALDKVRQATTETSGAMGGYGFHPDMDDEHSAPLPKFAAGGEVDDERRKQTSFSQFDPANRPQQVAPPLAMPPQQEAAPNIVESAAQDIQRRAQEAPPAAQPDTPKQATLGDVVMGGSGTAQVGPFEVSHLPRYGKRNADGADSGDGFLSRAWDGAKNTLKEAGAISSDVTNMALGYGTAPFSAVVDKARQGLTELAGGDVATLDGGPGRHMDASMGVGNMGYSNLARRASAAKDSIQAGMRSMLGVEKAEEPSPPPAPAASRRATSATQEPTEKTESPVTESPSATAAEPTTQEPERYASGIQKPQMVGGVPTFTNESVRGFDPASVNTISSQAMSSADPSTMDRLAEARAAAAARGEPVPGVGGFNPQGGTRFNVIPDSGRIDDMRRKAFAAASSPHKGAQNGQLTAAQMANMRGIISDQQADQRAGERIDIDRQAGARDFARVGHEASRLDIDQRKQALDEISKMPDIQQAQVRTGLYQQYLAAAEAGDTERTQAIAGMLQELGGKNSENLRNNFMAVGGGEAWDSQAGVMRKLPQRLVDLRTGQEVGDQPERRQQQFAEGKIYTDPVTGVRMLYENGEWKELGK